MDVGEAVALRRGVAGGEAVAPAVGGDSLVRSAGGAAAAHEQVANIVGVGHGVDGGRRARAGREVGDCRVAIRADAAGDGRRAVTPVSVMDDHAAESQTYNVVAVDVEVG